VSSTFRFLVFRFFLLFFSCHLIFVLSRVVVILTLLFFHTSRATVDVQFNRVYANYLARQHGVCGDIFSSTTGAINSWRRLRGNVTAKYFRYKFLARTILRNDTTKTHDTNCVLWYSITTSTSTPFTLTKIKYINLKQLKKTNIMSGKGKGGMSNFLRVALYPCALVPYVCTYVLQKILDSIDSCHVSF
jgi:hypothetical protein